MRLRAYLIIFAPICLVLVTLFSSLFNNMYKMSFYQEEYEKHNTYERFGEEKTIAVTNNLFKFFRNKEKLDNEFFSANEIAHLEDVKNLIFKGKYIYCTAILFLIITVIILYHLDEQEFLFISSKIAMTTGIALCFILFLFFVLHLLFGFDTIFLLFHKIFFAGNYAFDPKISNLKYMFPDEFFLNISLRILYSIMLKASLLILLSVFLCKSFKNIKFKKKKKK
ncbi:DUF1461 domain-containing protein [Candidatus Woesearchaeota archaeon]|nr:DUF1461 domain-containing protein [Candidatus Woesearchaeota archaeon]